MITKFTPKILKGARLEPMIIKWRASGKNGTLIKSPTLQELKDQALYSRVCSDYVTLMMRVIVGREKELYEGNLYLRPEEYYFKRYDVTAVECKILMNEILNKLK